MAMPKGSLFFARIRWGGVFSGSRESPGVRVQGQLNVNLR